MFVQQNAYVAEKKFFYKGSCPFEYTHYVLNEMYLCALVPLARIKALLSVR